MDNTTQKQTFAFNYPANGPVHIDLKYEVFAK